MNQEKRLEILKALQADNPTPKTELEYHSNFELLIAVVLSAQATDKSVNEATRVLFPLANTPQAVQLIFGGSGIVPAAMVAILLNILLPKEKEA